MSRTSNLLIKGGSNYSYNQISDELSKFVARQFRLAPSSFALAAVGRRFSSEHDDDCLVMVRFQQSGSDPSQMLESEASPFVAAGDSRCSHSLRVCVGCLCCSD